MLISKLNLIQWSSTTHARAQLRVPHCYRRFCKVESHFLIRSDKRPLSLKCRPALGHNPDDHVKSLPATVAWLSTTTSSRGKPRRYNANILKPRGKPKFHEKTKEEYDELVHALRDAQREDNARSMREAADAEDHTGKGLSNGKPIAFADSFFAVPELHLSDPSQREITYPQPDESASSPKSRRLARSQATTIDLEEELYYLAHNEPNPTAIHSILQILIYDRKIKPTAEYYEALILANTWPEYGSCVNVEKIIQEMDVEGIEMGQNIIAAVLKVLAIHPSPDLSHRMLTLMQRRWLVLTPQTQNHLLLSMIRTGQTELAAWQLDYLRQSRNVAGERNKEIVPDYLTVLLIVELQEMGDWEGVLRYFYKLRNRRAADREIPVAFWGWLLERASKVARMVSEAALRSNEPPSHTSDTPSQTTKNHISVSQTPDNSFIQSQLGLSNPAFELTSDIWSYYVTSMSLQPSWRTCLDILHSAANTGTQWLAESVTTTMTYLDGIDDQGRPKIHLDDSITSLVETTKRRAEENRARESEDVKRDRVASEEREMEKIKLKKDLDEWYAKLMVRFDEEKKGARGGEGESGSESGIEQTHPDPTLHDATHHQNSMAVSADTHPAQIESTTQPGQEKEYTVFDPSSVPIDNLWPLFPKLGSRAGAHVDPWNSLGPRSSSRRRWTEAQEHFKKVEKAQKSNKRWS